MVDFGVGSWHAQGSSACDKIKPGIEDRTGVERLPFGYDSSRDGHIDRGSHGVALVYLFVSEIFNITLQDR
jgi:hypothetical protein